MAVVSTNDLKRGMSLDLPDGLFQVVDFQHVKPGKGGAFVRTTLRNMRNGAQADRTFRADEKLDQAIIDKRDMQFLYRDGDDLFLMDNSTYEQIPVAASLVENVDLLAPNTDVQVLVIRDAPVKVELPTFVELTVTRTDPGVKGDTVSNVTKPAEVETGATVDVPLFVNEGDRLKIDTRTREYSARA